MEVVKAVYLGLPIASMKNLTEGIRCLIGKILPKGLS